MICVAYESLSSASKFVMGDCLLLNLRGFHWVPNLLGGGLG